MDGVVWAVGAAEDNAGFAFDSIFAIPTIAVVTG